MIAACFLSRPWKWSFLIFAVLLQARCGISAQLPEGSFKLQQGDPQVIRATDLLPRVFAGDASGYYAVSKKGSLFEISKYSPALERTTGGHLSVNEDLKERGMVDLLQFGDSLYLFFYTEGMNQRSLFLKVISKTGLEESGSARRIMQVHFVGGRKPGFGVVLSRDESKLLVYSSIIHYRSKRGILELAVFSPGMTLDWADSYIYSYERAPWHEQQFTVDPEGNVCMLDHYFTTPRPNITGRKNAYQILSVTDRGRTRRETRILLAERFIKSIRIEPAGPDHVLCAGFSSDSDLEGTVTNLFFFRVSTRQGTIRNYREHLLYPEDFISGERFGLRIGHLIYKPEGYAFLVAEQSVPEAHRRYQNLMVCRLEENGEMAWQQSIPKIQAYEKGTSARRGERRGYRPPVYLGPDGTPNPLVTDRFDQRPGSYFSAADGWGSGSEGSEFRQIWDYGSYALIHPIGGDWVGLAFNDHLKNLDPDRRKHRIFSSGRKSFLQVVLLDGTGSIKTTVACRRNRKSMPVPLPKYHYRTLDGKVIFPAAKMNNTFRMIELYD